MVRRANGLGSQISPPAVWRGKVRRTQWERDKGTGRPQKAGSSSSAGRSFATAVRGNHRFGLPQSTAAKTTTGYFCGGTWWNTWAQRRAGQENRVGLLSRRSEEHTSELQSQ